MNMDFEMFQQLLDEAQNSREQNVAARFYDRAVKTGEVNANGLPKFKNVCFAEIRIRDSHDVFDQPATPEKIKRFPVEYNRYLLSKKQAENGAPLEQFAFLTAAEIESLKYHGIFTVEALAALDEVRAENLGVAEERRLAQDFLKNAAPNADLNRRRAEEDRLRAENLRLREELEEYRRRLARCENKNNRRH